MNENDRSIVGLVMLAHGMVHTYELTVPIFLPIWLAEFSVVDLGVIELAVTTATLGAVVTIGYGLFGLGALPGGILVDRLGSRRLITACLIGMAASFLLLGVAPSVVAIAFALVVWGVSASVYHPAGLALISKGVNERGTGFAYHGIAGNLGIGLGPLVATILLLVMGWRTVALLLAVPALLAAAYAARADFDETAAVESDVAADGGTDAADGGRDAADDDSDVAADSDDSGTTSDAGGDSKADAGVESLAEFVAESRRLFAGTFALVFFVVICSGLYYRGVLTFLPALLEGLPGFEPIPASEIVPAALLDLAGGAANDRTIQPERYFYAGLLTVGVVGQYVGGKLTDRMPVEYGIVGGFAGLAVLAVLFLPVAALGVGPLIALGAVLGVFLFVVQPMYQAAVAEYTPSGTRGLSYGFTYLGVFGVGALGATVAGGVLAFASPPALFAVLAAFAAVAAGVGAYLATR